MATDFNAYFACLRVEHPRAPYPEPECSILVSYLNGDIDAQRSATEITKYTNRRVPVSSKLCIWSLIVQLGLDLIETHDELISLMKEIRSIPASKDTGGIDWANETQSFSEVFRGFYDGVHHRTLDADEAGGQNTKPDQSEASQQWTNINTFDAKLQHAGLSDDLLNGLLLIVKTLEKKTTPAQVQMNLGAVTAWLEFASKEIKGSAASVGAHTDWAQESEYKKGTQVDSKRLAFWKARLADYSDAPYVSEELATSCERATSAIEQALWEKKKKK